LGIETQEVKEETAEGLATGGKAVVRLLKLDLGISLTTEGKQRTSSVSAEDQRLVATTGPLR